MTNSPMTGVELIQVILSVMTIVSIIVVFIQMSNKRAVERGKQEEINKSHRLDIDENKCDIKELGQALERDKIESNKRFNVIERKLDVIDEKVTTIKR